MKNEPAFPGLHPSKECHYQDSGMRLRDYFAAKVIASLATYDEYPPERAAKYAYEYADAMLQAREQ